MTERRTHLVGRAGVSAADCMRIEPRWENESGSAYAYRMLAYNIIMLYMPPGAWIREAEVAALLNVSRTPVHEAMGLLRDRGLVEVAPQSASHVSRIDLAEMHQQFFMRAALVPAIVAKLCRTADVDCARALSEKANEIRAVARDPLALARYIELDGQFRGLMYRGCGEPYVWATLVKSGTAFSRTVNMAILYGFQKPNVALHDAVVAMCLSHDQEQGRTVAQTLHEDLSQVLGLLEGMQRDFPDCFK